MTLLNISNLSTSGQRYDSLGKPIPKSGDDDAYSGGSGGGDPTH